MNTTSTSYSVYLVGKATETSLGDILTATTKSFTLPPGLKTVITSELGDVDIDYQNEDIKNIIKNAGTIPSGNYTFCVTVYSSVDNEELGSRCTLPHDVNNLTIPVLISPLNKSFVQDGLPVFSWMPPTPLKASQNITYTLKIFEILPRQTPLDASLSNPPWYEKSNLSGTISVYPVTSRNFTEKTRYAWKVKAYLNGIFINESEIWEFTYGRKVKEIPRNKQPLKKTREGLKKGDNGKDSYGEKDSFGEKNSYGEKENYGYIGNTDLKLGASEKEHYPGGSGIDMSLKYTQVNLKTPFLFLTGSSSVVGQNSNRQGTNSVQPDDFLRWEFSPTLYLGDIPFSASLLLSTEQRSQLQNINNIAFNFNPDKLLERIRNKAEEKILNPAIEEYEEIKYKLQDTALKQEEVIKLKARLAELENIKEKLENISEADDPGDIISEVEKQGSKVPGFQKFLMGFRSLGIGTNYPSYTDYTLNGIPLTGANIEINYGLFYFAVAGLRNLKAVQKDENNQPTYERKVIGTRIGIGGYNSTHFYFTYLYGWDNENSVKTDSTMFIKPMKNHLLGLEGKISLIKNILNVEGEVGASLFTRDVTAPDIQNSDIPALFQNLFHVKISSSVDYFYTIKTSVNIDKTQSMFSAGMKMIGPGYRSLGAPNLRNDYLGFEIKLDQKFLNNQVSLSGFFKRDRDNLIPWKSSTTTNTYFGVLIGLRFSKLPYIQFNYSPYYQKNNQLKDNLKVDNKTTLYTLATGYGYSIGNLFSFTNVILSLQESRTLIKLNDFSTDNIMLTQSVSFLFPLTVSAGFTMTEIRFSNMYSNIKSFDLSASYTAFDIWNNTAGVSYAYDKNEYNKTGIFISSSIPVWKIGDFEVRAEKNKFKDELTGNTSYNEFLIKATLTSNW